MCGAKMFPNSKLTGVYYIVHVVRFTFYILVMDLSSWFIFRFFIQASYNEKKLILNNNEKKNIDYNKLQVAMKK